jgi:hypothetical protein
MKTKIIYLLLTTVILQLNFSCDSVEPPIDDLKPGRRDYVWTVDTLQVPEGVSYPSSMWGANENNVWAIGYGYLNAYQIWHYNGNKWMNYVPNEYIDPRGICGLSENDIWTSSLGINNIPAAFWHYDGTKWSKFSEIIIDGYEVIIQSIAGSAPNNIYAVGYADSIGGQSFKAIIFHFNGNMWKQVNIPIIRNSFGQVFYDESSGKFLIKGWTFDTINQFIYSFTNNSLDNILITQEEATLCSIGKETYLNIKGKILKYQNNNFEILKDFISTNYTGNAWGRNEKDFFTINSDGIGHYNGTDLVTIYQKRNNEWVPDGGIVFEKDVFFIWDDSFNTFVIHGKLKD